MARIKSIHGFSTRFCALRRGGRWRAARARRALRHALPGGDGGWRWTFVRWMAGVGFYMLFLVAPPGSSGARGLGAPRAGDAPDGCFARNTRGHNLPLFLSSLLSIRNLSHSLFLFFAPLKTATRKMRIFGGAFVVAASLYLLSRLF